MIFFSSLKPISQSSSHSFIQQISILPIHYFFKGILQFNFIVAKFYEIYYITYSICYSEVTHNAYNFTLH